LVGVGVIEGVFEAVLVKINGVRVKVVVGVSVIVSVTVGVRFAASGASARAKKPIQ
jgi:hypothetical protein